MEDYFTNTVEDAARFESARGVEPDVRPHRCELEDDPDDACPECGTSMHAKDCEKCGFEHPDPGDRCG